MSGFPYFPDENIDSGNKQPLSSTNIFGSSGNSENENENVKDLYRFYCFSPISRTGNKTKRHQRTSFTSPALSPFSKQRTEPKRTRVLLESSNYVQPVPFTHEGGTVNHSLDPKGSKSGFDGQEHHRGEIQEHHYDHERHLGPYSSAAMHVPPFGVHRVKPMNSHSSAWNERFQELLKYKAEFGDCLVPQRYPKNPQLGVWVNKQRAEYKLLKEGKKSSMTEERIRTLESVGFVWAKRRKGQPTWDLKFEELTMYKHKHGDCLVPTKYTENPALGRWVSTQRAQYKLMKEGKPTTMTDERVLALERIGFVWRLQF